MRADVAIIGAGAAGLMAAVLLSKAGIHCDMYEKKDRCGLKLGITGKGRGNLTNACPAQDMRANIMSGDKFLFSAFSRFDSSWVMDFFESRGLKLKVERGGRVFPVSDRALDAVGTLMRSIDGSVVDIIHKQVAAVASQPDGRISITSGGETRDYKAVLIATGGLSYPQTGSTGDGFTFARLLGHTVVDARASLTGLCCDGTECAAMAGLSLKNVTLTLIDGKGRKIYSELGEALFTHFGISGPLALTASAYYTHRGLDRARAVIDFKPGLAQERLDARLLRDFSAELNRSFRNSLSALLPSSAVPVIVSRSGIDPDKAVNSITRTERLRLCNIIKGLDFDVTGLRPIEEAIITAGGVSLREVDPKTMVSKLVRGIYFAGEVLDADALTGGFNLQIAFSTAACAAQAIADYLSLTGRNA